MEASLSLFLLLHLPPAPKAARPHAARPPRGRLPGPARPRDVRGQSRRDTRLPGPAGPQNVRRRGRRDTRLPGRSGSTRRGTPETEAGAGRALGRRGPGAGIPGAPARGQTGVRRLPHQHTESPGGRIESKERFFRADARPQGLIFIGPMGRVPPSPPGQSSVFSNSSPRLHGAGRERAVGGPPPRGMLCCLGGAAQDEAAHRRPAPGKARGTPRQEGASHNLIVPPRRRQNGGKS